MPDVAYSTFVAGLALDTIGGSEKIAVVDVSTNKHVTADTLKTYIISALAGAAAVTPTTGDAVIMERSGTEGTFDLDALADYCVDRAWSNAAEVTPATNADKLLADRSGTVVELDIDTIATYVNSAVLDLTALDAATPGASDLVLFGSGSTPKKVTLTNFETVLWADFLTYVDGLAENTTVTASDKLYVIQGGVAKWVDPDALATYFSVPAGDVTGPVTTTENNVPQWDSGTKELKDGLSLQTTVRASGTAADTALATEKAVRDAVDLVTSSVDDLDIDGATDIGAALVDADLILVDDGASGTNRKSEMSRVWTYIASKDHAITVLDIDGATDIGAALVDADLIIVDDGAGGTNRKSEVSRVWDYVVTKIQATPNKAVPVDGDIVMIQDSANSNVITELTVGNLRSYIGTGIKNNFSASSNPTATDDSDSDYEVGSRWVNLSTDSHYECADATVGAAVWTNVSASAAGWDGDITDVDFTTGSDIGADIADTDRVIVGDASDSNNPKRSEASRVKKYVNKIQTASYSGNQTLTVDECHGYIVYVTGAATITLPAIADGMSVTILTEGAVAVSVDPNASDKIFLDGTALDDGDKITNTSTSGDIAVLTYRSADGWYAVTNGWSDGGA